jgi:putative spermidine/putrescine transport system permease protein
VQWLARAGPWLLGTALAAPLVGLVVRAFADAWRAPAVVPQQLGTGGFAYAFSPAAGAGTAVVNSLVVALAATAVALAVGWPAARVLGEGRLRRPLPVFLVLAVPLLVSPFATGTGLAAWFIRLGLADSLPGLVLAHLVYVTPYVVLLLAPAFGARVTELEEAARSLGAGTLRRLLSVTVPAVRPALAAAALLGFLVSFSQYGTSLAVGGGLPMLPLVLVPFVGADPQVAAALALLFLAPAVAALVLATRAGRPLG